MKLYIRIIITSNTMCDKSFGTFASKVVFFTAYVCFFYETQMSLFMTLDLITNVEYINITILICTLMCMDCLGANVDI